MSYEAIIGLEIHAQLSTQTKAWCFCEINTTAYENTKTCPVCTAQPGTLPFLNTKAVDYAIRAGLALNCEINLLSKFDRKNYFYPDLPKGYQITQFERPIAINGSLSILDDEGHEKKVGIQRIQMEEDTGKSMHMGDSSLINLNRSGTPLIEIVGEPDIRSAKEASGYFKKIQSILVYLDICHGNMQEGNLRCDVNLSLRKKGAKEFGTRTEVKNLNSFRSVERAIAYEWERQASLLDNGQKVQQQTLLFDVESGKTRVLRTKSDADDYRYFPEPDLMPLVITQERVVKIKEELPELPDDKIRRFVTDYSLPLYDAEVLSSSLSLANYFEECLTFFDGEPKKISNWVMVELLKLINEYNADISKSPVPAKELASLVNFVQKGEISGKIGKDVLVKMYDEKKTASEVINELGVKQISDTDSIEKIVREIVDSNPGEVEKYLNGKDRVFGFFVGQVMKQTKGQANPQIVSETLKKILSEKNE